MYPAVLVVAAGMMVSQGLQILTKPDVTTEGLSAIFGQ